MKNLSRILFVANGVENEQIAFARAVWIAKSSEANVLTIMDTCPRPALPSRDTFDEPNADDLAPSITAADKQRLLVSNSAVVELQEHVRVEFLAERSIEQVIEATRQHDLVIKPAGKATFSLFQQGSDEDRKLMRGAFCPVWTVNGFEQQVESHVLAAIDLTPIDSIARARKVLRQATAFARGANVPLHVVAGWRVLREREIGGRGKLIRMRKQTKKSLRKELKALMREFELPKKTVRLIHGDLHHVIPDYVRVRGYDLVVLEERPNWLQRLTGSAAQRLLAAENCSVLTVNGNRTATRLEGQASLVKSRTESRAPTVL